jgi:hypothetical protein
VRITTLPEVLAGGNDHGTETKSTPKSLRQRRYYPEHANVDSAIMSWPAGNRKRLLQRYRSPSDIDRHDFAGRRRRTGAASRRSLRIRSAILHLAAREKVRASTANLDFETWPAGQTLTTT